MLNEDELIRIELRCSKAQKGPWKAFIEGRDHESGTNFIMTGEGTERGGDIEMLGATVADFNFIAHAKQDVPKLIEEIRRLSSEKNYY
ncbi:MAG: hypothetical protein ACXVBR_11815 [Flavisolibacter sp.]